MKKKRIITSAAIMLTSGLIVIIAAVLYIYSTRSQPVLIELTESDSVAGYPFWALLHPLRDQGPERDAEELLLTLKRGDFKEAFSGISWSDDHRKLMLRRETFFPIKSWKLITRSDSSGQVKLFYMAIRVVVVNIESQGEEFKSPVWITLEQSDPNGAWIVVQFESLS